MASKRGRLFVGIGWTLPMVVVLAAPVWAVSKGKVCKQSCGTAIQSCTETGSTLGFGDLAKGCKASVLKNCKRNGPAVCTAFVAPGCPNGKREFSEQCDGSDLGGVSCTTLGFATGAVKCSSDCTVDVADCDEAPQDVTLPGSLASKAALWLLIQSDGAGGGLNIDEGASTGGADLYDGAWFLRVDGTLYDPGPAATRVTGETRDTLRMATQTLAGLTVAADITAFRASSTLRLRYRFTNPGAAPVNVTVEVTGNLGSDGGTTIRATSSGDTTFDAADRWLVTDDNGTPPGDPVHTGVFLGPGAGTVPTAASSSTDNFSVTFTLSVPANATRALVFFAQMHDLSPEAIADAAIFDTNAGAEGAGILSGLTSGDLAEVANWAF